MVQPNETRKEKKKIYYLLGDAGQKVHHNHLASPKSGTDWKIVNVLLKSRGTG